MTVEENLRVIDSQDEAVNVRDWDRFAGFFAESYLGHSVDNPEPLKGIEALVERLKTLDNAFPDFRAEKVRAFGQGDWVCAEYTITGTHTGPLPGPGGEMIPATNKPFRFQNLLLFKVEGGKITETQQYYDQLGLMAQLGLAP